MIQRPPFDVFDYLMDVERFWEWAPYFVDTRAVDWDANDWPTVFEARVGLSWDLSIRSQVSVSNVQRGKSITYRSEEPPQVATYMVEPTLSGTILTARHSPWPILGISMLQSAINIFAADYLRQALSTSSRRSRPGRRRRGRWCSCHTGDTSRPSISLAGSWRSSPRSSGMRRSFRDLATISAGEEADAALEQGLLRRSGRRKYRTTSSPRSRPRSMTVTKRRRSLRAGSGAR